MWQVVTTFTVMPKNHIELPEDVRKHVLRYQAELKIKKGIAQYSISNTVAIMLREHEQLTKPRIFLK